ncbi:hypothetical protein JHK86_004319 [Glycine max]|nr:hypothetical protein JHK86_004319 [Glycine max]
MSFWGGQITPHATCINGCIQTIKPTRRRDKAQAYVLLSGNQSWPLKRGSSSRSILDPSLHLHAFPFSYLHTQHDHCHTASCRRRHHRIPRELVVLTSPPVTRTKTSTTWEGSNFNGVVKGAVVQGGFANIAGEFVLKVSRHYCWRERCLRGEHACRRNFEKNNMGGRTRSSQAFCNHQNITIWVFEGCGARFTVEQEWDSEQNRKPTTLCRRSRTVEERMKHAVPAKLCSEIRRDGFGRSFQKLYISHHAVVTVKGSVVWGRSLVISCLRPLRK